MKKLIISFLIFFVAFPANAYFMNGNDLVSKMREHEKAIRSDRDTNYSTASEYLGYVTGIYDVLESRDDICPAKATRGQIAAVVVKYLNENPARWSEPASYLVKDALLQAFPCSK